MEPTNNETNVPAKKSNKGLGIGIAAVGLVAIAAIAVFAGKSSEDPVITTDPNATVDTSSTTPSTTTSAPATNPASTASSTSTYKDGTYTATGSYVSPGGPDQISVTLTLKGDVVTDASVNPMPGDPESAHYQSIFAANYKPLVVGKKITDVKLSKVSGSSLTSGGFNAAVLKIETQAQA